MYLDVIVRSLVEKPSVIRGLTLLSLALIVFGLSPKSRGQEVEEVVVTAEQTESATDELVSVSAIDGEKLADAGIENIEDVAAYVPNLVLSETDTGTNIVIRGIGAGVNQGFDQSVGLYIDGVPLPRGQMARAPFLDLDNVDVLRGPQYVRDGNYSIAGSLHMYSRSASDDFEVGIDVTNIPDFGESKILLTTSIPLDFANGGMRLALERKLSDGYVENVARNESGPQADNLLLRGVFSSQPTDSFSFKLKYERGDFNTRGRQIEILESQPVPDFRTFPEVIANGPRDARAPLSGSVRGLITEVRNEIDFANVPFRTRYDQGYVADSEQQDIPVFAGRSYLEVWRDLYANTGPLTEITLSGLTYPFVSENGPLAPPIGLLDDTVNFKRAADAEEFSENLSTNLTLNAELLLGESKLDWIASYVEYDYSEEIDLDFTPVPIFEGSQNEEYTQQFYRFDFTSPSDRFFELTAGLSYLDSSLEFSDTTETQIDPAQNQQEGVEVLQRILDVPFADRLREALSFDPKSPFISYLALTESAGVDALRLYTPTNLFTQDANTFAAFAEGTFNWSDSFRTIFGVRYTHSKKEAVRDFAFLLGDGTAFDVPSDGALAQEEAEARALYAIILNFEPHSDRMPFDSDRLNDLSPSLGGTRREEAFLPTIGVEWDVTNDLSLNASIRFANKLGGFDARSVSTPTASPGLLLAPGTFEFEDEQATTYELGAKWYLPADLGELRATAFFTDYKNLQVSSQDRSVGFNVRNAGAAKTYGVEAEGLLLLSERFNINYSFAWIEFEFTDYPVGTCPLGRRPDFFLQTSNETDIPARFPLGSRIPIVYEDALLEEEAQTNRGARAGFGIVPPQVDLEDPGGFANIQRYDFQTLLLPAVCDFRGQTNQYVAEWQGTFSFDYEAELSRGLILKPVLDVLYNSGYETTVTQDSDVAQDEYIQLNGRLALKNGEDLWEIAVTVENMTNEKIVLYAAELPVATRIQGSKSHYGFVRPSRAVGVNFRYKFF